MNKISKGEEKVRQILSQHRVSFIPEFTFNDLKGKNETLLRFDFAVVKNGRLYVLIEVDGSPHFIFTPYFHKTYSKFKQTLERDRKKNKYCLLHQIPLIRIPYWEIETLTFEKIFSNPNFLVKNIYHNDYLRGGVKR